MLKTTGSNMTHRLGPIFIWPMNFGPIINPAHFGPSLSKSVQDRLYKISQQAMILLGKE